MPYCEHCGKRISDEAKFCRNCGCEVIEISDTKEPPKPTEKEPSPPPKEEPVEEDLPTKSLKIGGIGALLAAFGVIIFGLQFTPITNDDSTFWLYTMAISCILIAIGSIIVGVGFYGFYRNYDQILGAINFLVGISTAVIWLILSAIITNSESLSKEGITPLFIVLILCLIFSGIMLIFQGANIYNVRDHIGYPRLAKTQSTISIVAGVCCGSVIMVLLFGIGLYLWAVAYFLLIPVFFTSETSYKKEEELDEDLLPVPEELKEEQSLISEAVKRKGPASSEEAEEEEPPPPEDIEDENLPPPEDNEDE